MLSNSLEYLFLVLVLKCSFSYQQSNNCINVVIVTNANSEDGQKSNEFQSSPEECKQHCLFENCEMASWNKNDNSCSIYSGISSNISPLEDSEIYFISKVNSCEYKSLCNDSRANEWSPIESVGSLKRMALESINTTDILKCAEENFRLGHSFVFDFSSPEKCFKITGYGINNRKFSKQSYIYLEDQIFFSPCSVMPKQLSIPTKFSAYSPPTTIYSTLSPFQAQMLRWDYKPLVLRPAYIVLVSLGGACLLMTLVAVLALCQGKLGSGGGMSRKMNYSAGSTEPVEVHNQVYDSDSKIPEESVDLTLPHQGEYFNRTEVMD